ncbi:hypothetical protein BH18CHL2_BH18CHL2_09030 [soil metagenome]
MTVFAEVLARLSRAGAAALAGQWTWPEAGRGIEARYARDRAVEQEHVAAVAVAGEGRREPARILALAQLAFGDARGVLAALPEALLDGVTEPGEWTVRSTCEHTIRVERSYRAAALWAVEREAGGPVVIPEARRPQTDPADTEGSALDIVGRFELRRAETDRALEGLSEAALSRPSVWSDIPVDLRFRLHRFASHIQEHTIQIEKSLEALGWRPGDAPRAARRLSVARAMHERTSPPEVLDRLDADHLAKAVALGV